MDINDLTVRQAREIAKMFPQEQKKSHPTAFVIGRMYHIRTVTMAHAGLLIDVTRNELVLENASWIADSGKFSEALKDSKNYNEVEMFPAGSRVIIGRGALVDAVEINSLPSATK